MDTERYNNLVAQAWHYYRVDNAKTSLARCIEALAILPHAIEPMYLAGICALQLGDLSTASQFAASMIGLEPNGSSGHLLLGFLSEQEQNYKKALGHFKEAMRLEPDDPVYYAMVGTTLGKLDRLEEGITVACKGLKLAPDNTVVLYALQQLYRLNDEPQLAEKFGKLALAQNPDDADHHLEIGLNFLKKGNSNQASRSLMESLRINPQKGDSFEVIAHEKVRQYPVFKNMIFPPTKPALLVPVLLTPLIWFGLSWVFYPFIYLMWAALVAIVFGYGFLGLFFLLRHIALAQLRKGRL